MNPTPKQSTHTKSNQKEGKNIQKLVKNHENGQKNMKMTKNRRKKHQIVYTTVKHSKKL